MAGTGKLFKLDEAVVQEFRKMKSKLGQWKGWLKLQIEDKTKIVLTGSGEPVENIFAPLHAAAEQEPKAHCFFLAKSPLGKKQFFVLHWGPDAAPVKDRMLYASGRQTIKDTLGSSDFTDDFYVNTLAELTLENYTHEKETIPQIDVRTQDEIEKEEADAEQIPMGTKTTVLTQLNVKTSEGTDGLLKEYLEGSVNTIIMTIEKKTQNIESTKGSDNYAELCSVLDDTGTPAFILHRFNHADPNGEAAASSMFVYFSPTGATDRRARFTYSLCKSNALSLIESKGIAVDDKARFECGSMADEMSAQKVLEALYPEQKEIVHHAKAAAPAQRRRGKKKKKKLVFDEE